MSDSEAEPIVQRPSKRQRTNEAGGHKFYLLAHITMHMKEEHISVSMLDPICP
jgi:hypothetical protein